METIVNNVVCTKWLFLYINIMMISRGEHLGFSKGVILTGLNSFGRFFVFNFFLCKILFFWKMQLITHHDYLHLFQTRLEPSISIKEETNLTFTIWYSQDKNPLLHWRFSKSNSRQFQFLRCLLLSNGINKIKLCN